MTPKIIVDASEAEVRAALSDGLSVDERAQFIFAEQPKAVDPFEAPDRGEAISQVTVIVWTGQAVASGVVGGIAYDLLKKTAALLEKKFGKEQVAVEEPPAD